MLGITPHAVPAGGTPGEPVDKILDRLPRIPEKEKGQSGAEQ